MYEFALEDMLQRMLYFQPEVWPALRASMELYPCRGPEQEELSDFAHGSFCRSHEFLGVGAEDDGSFRMGYGLYNDGIEMVNPLGSFIQAGITWTAIIYRFLGFPLTSASYST